MRVSAARTQTLTGLFGTTWLRAVPTGTDPNGAQEPAPGASTIVWANASAYAQPAAGVLPSVDRTDTNLRSQFRSNLDVVFNKAVKTGGSTRAELRIEMLNITNTPKFRDYNTFIDNATFGVVSRQAGFSRIAQVSFRYTF